MGTERNPSSMNEPSKELVSRCFWVSDAGFLHITVIRCAPNGGCPRSQQDPGLQTHAQVERRVLRYYVAAVGTSARPRDSTLGLAVATTMAVKHGR